MVDNHIEKAQYLSISWKSQKSLSDEPRNTQVAEMRVSNILSVHWRFTLTPGVCREVVSYLSK